MGRIGITPQDRLIRKMTELQGVLDDERCYAPHCDPSVLHAPGQCIHCDLLPDWQEIRRRWRINFTGHQDPDKAPCPAEHFRPAETIHRWHGNVPMTEEMKKQEDEYWAEFHRELENQQASK